MESKLYNLNDKYYTSHCAYIESTVKENRKVGINWPLNISKIILLSKQDKTIKLNIAENILIEEKKETVCPVYDVNIRNRNIISRSSSSSSSRSRSRREQREQSDTSDTSDFSDEFSESLRNEPIYESKVQESCNVSLGNMNIISFWQTIELINWYDKDEKLLGKFSITNKFNRITRMRLFDMLNNIILPILKEKLSLLLESIDIENHNNILTHIVMKGQVFYDFIISNPVVCFYLIDQFYPVYDWLR
jgi:hypothetical protein